MRTDVPSSTARIIAAATISAAGRPEVSACVPREAASWSRRFLQGSIHDRVLAWSVESRCTRATWRAVEACVQPGIVQHWMRRKLWIERRVRAAIADGYTRLVVLGAGLDTLGVRLSVECAECEVVEIDHPATQKLKQRVLDSRGGESPVLIAADLLHCLPSWELLGFSPRAARSGGTIVMAEGLLMYMPPARVRQILEWAAQAPTERARLIFSFMIARDGRPIGFEPRSRLVERWLALRAERFLWALRPDEAERFAGSLGWRVTLHADADTLAAIETLPQVIARGEEVVEAERIQ